jgi:hypothetical protein
MIYYLDKTNGNDTNSGTSINNAFATWSKVLTVNVSGDTVYVLPAYYNEVITTTQNGVKYIAINDGVDSYTQNLITSSITYSGSCFISAFNIDDNIVNSNVRIINNKNDVWFVGFTIITYGQNSYTSIVSSTNNLIDKCNIDTRGQGTIRSVYNMGGITSNNGNIIRRCKLISPYRTVENCNIIEYSEIQSLGNAILTSYISAFNKIVNGTVSTLYTLSNDIENGSTGAIFRTTAYSTNTMIAVNNLIYNSSTCLNNTAGGGLLSVKNYAYLSSTLNLNAAANTSNSTILNMNDTYYTNNVVINTGTNYIGTAKELKKYNKRCDGISLNKHELGFSIDDSKYSVSGSSLNYFMNYNFDLTSTIYNSNPVYYNPNNYTLFYSTSNYYKIVLSSTTNDSISNYYSGSTLNCLFYGVGTYSGDTCYMYDYVNLVDYYNYTVDYNGLPLRNYDNTMQIGCTQSSDIDIIDENTIKINRKGYNTIKLKVLKNQTYKIDTYLEFSGSTNPFIHIYDYENNDIIKNIEYEISGLTNGVETNIDYITFKPNKTGIIRIIFYNSDYNVNSYLIVKDFKIHTI